MKFIGDVHGKYNQYERIISECENSIQVGDMGVGFKRQNPVWGQSEYFPNPSYDKMVLGNHRFIRGNHDNPAVCMKHTQYIPDGHTENGMMFIGGALSIDRDWRTEGFDYWTDEELTQGDFYWMMDVYKEYKPKIMVTHECPDSIADLLLNNRAKFKDGSITRQAFDGMFKEYKPEVHIFGHWHVDFDQVILGTRFICLNELSTIDLDMNDLTKGEIVPNKA